MYRLLMLRALLGCYSGDVEDAGSCSPCFRLEPLFRDADLLVYMCWSWCTEKQSYRVSPNPRSLGLSSDADLPCRHSPCTCYADTIWERSRPSWQSIERCFLSLTRSRVRLLGLLSLGKLLRLHAMLPVELILTFALLP